MLNSILWTSVCEKKNLEHFPGMKVVHVSQRASKTVNFHQFWFFWSKAANVKLKVCVVFKRPQTGLSVYKVK